MTVVGPFVKPRPPRFWVVVLAAAFALLQLANVTGRDTPDTKNYLSYALSLRGASKHEAAAATIDYACAGPGVPRAPRPERRRRPLPRAEPRRAGRRGVAGATSGGGCRSG